MLDFDASKLLIIGMVALVVIGPKDLPRVLRQVGQAVTKLRRMASDFQGQFMDAVKEADLQDLKNEVSKLKDSATLDVKFDPIHDVRNELSGVLAPRPATSSPLDPVVQAPQAVPHEAGAFDALPGIETTSLALRPPVFGAASTPEVSVSDVPADLPADLPVAIETAAFSSDSVGDGVAPLAAIPMRRRKITVPKRRAPGNRLVVARSGATMLARSRLMLPPRREDPRI